MSTKAKPKPKPQPTLRAEVAALARKWQRSDCPCHLHSARRACARELRALLRRHAKGTR